MYLLHALERTSTVMCDSAARMTISQFETYHLGGWETMKSNDLWQGCQNAYFATRKSIWGINHVK
jgi:hypothetical protein